MNKYGGKMQLTRTQTGDEPWLVPAAEIAEASGLSESDWYEAVGEHIVDPRFRQGDEYTDLALLFEETTFELSCRFGHDAERLTLHALRELTPHLIGVWQEAKRTGSRRTIEVVVRDGGGEDAVRFQLGAVARTLARFEGDEALVTESLSALRDVAYQQREDGTYARLAALAETMPEIPAK
jgi:hypothetical protein